MRIVQLCDFGDDGDARHRMHEPSRALGRLDGVTAIDCHFAHRQLPDLAARADVLVLQFVNDWDLLTLCERRRAAGRVTVFEANDDFFDLQPWSPTSASWRDRGVQELYRQLLMAASGVQTSSEALAKRWRSLGAERVAVFRNHLAEIPPLMPSPDRPFTIGWGGSPGHFADWYDVAPTLNRWLVANPDVQLSVMTHELARPFFDLPADRNRFTPFGSLDDYLGFLGTIDVGIAPLLPTAYNRGRSDVKFLEYASRGVVGLYTELEPYRGSVIDGETGLFYRSHDELISGLDRLRTDLTLRERLRTQAHSAVAKGRRLDDRIGERLDWYRALLTRKPDEVETSARRESGYVRLVPEQPERVVLSARREKDAGVACRTLAPLVEQLPHYVAASITLGRKWNDRREPKEALEILRPALARSPGDPRILGEIGRSWFLLGNAVQALAAIEAAIRVSPRDLPSWLSLLRLLSQVPNPDAASWANHAERLFPLCYPAGLAAIAIRAADDAPEALRRVIERTAPTLKADERPTAIAAFSKSARAVVAAAPTSPGVVPMLTLACKLFPESARMAGELGRALRRNGQHAEAHAHESRALALRRCAAVDREEFAGEDAPEYGWMFSDLIVKSRSEAVEAAPTEVQRIPSMRDPARTQLAYRLYQQGERSPAEALCEEVLRLDPRDAEARYLLGVIALDRGDAARACDHFQLATELAPENAVFLSTRGEALVASGRPEDAETCFLRAIALKPDYERAHNNLGRLRHGRGDLEAAEACFAEAVRLNPKYATARNNLGAVLQAKEKLAEANEQFRAALEVRPEYPEALFNLGTVLQAQGDPLTAAERFREAIRLRPEYARAHFHLGQVLETCRRDYDALASYQAAVRLQPDHAEMQRKLGDLLVLKKDWPAAMAALERAVELAPGDPDAFAAVFRARQQICDWRSYDADVDRLWTDAATRLASGEATPVTPFQSLGLPWDASRLLDVARSHSSAWARSHRRALATAIQHRKKIRDGCIRVGYLSGDFSDHPISHLLQGLFGRHDRDRFEVFAYSFGPADRSSYRRRIASECEHFIECGTLSIPGIAGRIADDGIDILVDLMGFTGVHRLGTLALRPAPIQVSFLGMLGTMGADFLDYLITDPVVTPASHAPHFTERFATLPHSYLIAEPEVEAPPPADRRALGLPQDGFVFCCFNTPYKFEPSVFSSWMRILSAVPGSVLWVCSPGDQPEANLRREAAARGVDPSRLVFAPFVPRPDHLRRHRAADLFLDTRLYNAAATASLSLQVGVPVLTCLGETFASRVGASLLHAVGLPELVAQDTDDYERMAIQLARDPGRMVSLRNHLEDCRTTAPLFDTARFVRNLERAFTTMWDIHAEGAPPSDFVIEEDDADIPQDMRRARGPRLQFSGL